MQAPRASVVRHDNHGGDSTYNSVGSHQPQDIMAVGVGEVSARHVVGAHAHDNEMTDDGDGPDVAECSSEAMQVDSDNQMAIMEEDENTETHLTIHENSYDVPNCLYPQTTTQAGSR